MTLLSQYINTLKLLTFKEKLTAIMQLYFLSNVD